MAPPPFAATRMKRLKTENARKKDKYRIRLKRERNKKDIEKDIQTKYTG